MNKTPQFNFDPDLRGVKNLLIRFIAQRVKGDSDALEEVFSRTIEAAFTGYKTFKHKSKFFTWVCRIALNKIADYYRGQVNEKSRLVAPFLENIAYIEDTNITPDEKLALDDLRVSIRNCLDVLPTDIRNLLYLRYWEELTIKQIAFRTNIPERAVEGKIYRAKQLLKKIFESKYPETSEAFAKK